MNEPHPYDEKRAHDRELAARDTRARAMAHVPSMLRSMGHEPRKGKVTTFCCTRCGAAGLVVVTELRPYAIELVGTIFNTDCL